MRSSTFTSIVLSPVARYAGSLLMLACLGFSPIAAAGAGANKMTYNVPLSASYWTTIYDGNGSVNYNARTGIVMSPQASTSPLETHSALTLANIAQMRNFKLLITAATDTQLRQNSAPNSWETFWIFFNYLPASTKTTNYFVLKTNGVELGAAYNYDGQTFLQTGETMAIAVGVSNKFEIDKIDNHVVVYINGIKAIDFTGAIEDVAGYIGLYTEDARVHITNVQVTPL